MGQRMHVFFQFPPVPNGVIVPTLAETPEHALGLAAAQGLTMTPDSVEHKGKTWTGYRNQHGNFFVLRRVFTEEDMGAVLDELGMHGIRTVRAWLIRGSCIYGPGRAPDPKYPVRIH